MCQDHLNVFNTSCGFIFHKKDDSNNVATVVMVIGSGEV